MGTSNSRKAFDVVNYLLLGLFGILTIYPFYYLLIYSLSDANEAMKGVFFYPRGLSIENYKTVFKIDNLLHATMISVGRTVLGTVLTVICYAFFAYGLTKAILPFRKLMYRTLVVSMYVSGGLIPTYMLISDLHLKNTFLVYIIPGIVVAFYLILIKTYTTKD